MTPVFPKLGHWTEPFPKGMNWVVCSSNINWVKAPKTPWLSRLIGREGWHQMVPL